QSLTLLGMILHSHDAFEVAVLSPKQSSEHVRGRQQNAVCQRKLVLNTEVCCSQREGRVQIHHLPLLHERCSPKRIRFSMFTTDPAENLQNTDACHDELLRGLDRRGKNLCVR